MSSQLPQVFVEQGWDEGIPDCITMLEELRTSGALNVEPVLAVLRAHQHLPGPGNGRTVIPLAEDYPTRQVLEDGVGFALMYLRNKILRGGVELGKELCKMVTLFGLHRYRAAAQLELAPKSGQDGERDTAADVLRYLIPVDGIILTLYKARARPDVRNAMFGVGIFAYEMYQNLCVNQEFSGQTPDEFFQGIRRRASPAHLALLYEALAFPLISAPNRHQTMTHKELLRVAELATMPLEGARAQSLYARELNAELKRTHTIMSDIQVYLLRPAEGIWTSLSGKCAQCTKETDRRCTRCKRVVYCGTKCQSEHWEAAHKGACSLFEKVNVKLQQDGYSLPFNL